MTSSYDKLIAKFSLQNYGVPLYHDETPMGFHEKDRRKLHRGGIEPKDFLLASESTYKSKAFDKIDNFLNKVDGSTVDVFVNPKKKEVLIGIRGTKDFKDISADALIALGSLTLSSRYIDDDDDMKKIIKEYPPEKYDYYLSGHSLGGAIVAEFMRRYPFIKKAMAFNSASQIQDLLNQDPKIDYNFIDRDPLYNFTGHFLKKKKVYPYQPGLNKNKDRPSMLQAHSLNQFNKVFGVRIPGGCHNCDKLLSGGCLKCSLQGKKCPKNKSGGSGQHPDGSRY